MGTCVAQYIYTLEKARKAHGDKVVLDNVTLSFLPGAKIGVVGPNGAGKSSLLKIMAGLDMVSNGDARLMPGYTVGMVAQEPRLDESKTVLENIELAVAGTKAKLARFNEIAELMATDYSDELMDEMGSSRRSSTTPTPGTSTPSSSRRWTRCAARRRTPRPHRCPVVRSAGSRSASCCWSSPTCCCSTSPPTTSTPRACSGWSSTSRNTPAR